MDNEKRAKKEKYYLISGVSTFLLGLILLLVFSGMKDSWEYYLSSSHQQSVDMGCIWAWILIIWGAIELWIGGFLYAQNGASESERPASSKPEKTVERIDWIEGEIVQKEWDPEHHQVEWITVRQKNGLTIRAWHYIADDRIYKVGERGRVCVKDRLITEFVPAENGE